ncbi:hypothetical protein MPSEU_000407900 [Mayamaea pseudoterrestris]|nr:hypothetical protein MPSEU_000407900 [Mayamaea pseudoterrestris]
MASQMQRLQPRGMILSLLLLLLSPSQAFLVSPIRSLSFYSPRCVNALRAPSSPSDDDVTLNHDEIARYSRHLVLSDVGMAGQLALKRSSVLVIGAGGLGSPCLLYLAAAGVGHIGIVDADTVDASNLQRQIIHATSTVGVSKCESAAIRMNDLNPNVNVRVYEQEFTSETAMDILGQGFAEGQPYDIVIDGSDNFPTKYLINDVCSMVGVPWIYSAILAFEGQLSVFNVDANSPDYRDLLPVPPPPGDVPSCAEGGVLGVLPGTMGCLQATEALKYLLGRREGLLVGRVLVFDALQMKFTQIGLQKTPGREPIASLIDYQGFCGGPKPLKQSAVDGNNEPVATTEAQVKRTMDEAEVVTADSAHGSEAPSFHSIPPPECLDRLSSGWAPYVLDVRLETEHDIVALPFTDRVVPHRQVQVSHIPTDGDVLVYCKAGVRGKKACQALVKSGVAPDRLYNLEGGIMQWQKEVDTSMPRY